MIKITAVIFLFGNKCFNTAKMSCFDLLLIGW